VVPALIRSATTTTLLLLVQLLHGTRFPFLSWFVESCGVWPGRTATVM